MTHTEDTPGHIRRTLVTRRGTLPDTCVCTRGEKIVAQNALDTNNRLLDGAAHALGYQGKANMVHT